MRACRLLALSQLLFLAPPIACNGVRRTPPNCGRTIASRPRYWYWPPGTRILAAAVFLSAPALAAAAPHWGAITAKGCVRTNVREWSAILWDIPWGQSWERTCARTRGTVNGARPRVPDRCVTSINEWGVWHVRDSTCQAPPPPPPAPSATFRSFTTEPAVVCANADNPLVRIRFSAHSSGDSCVRFQINGQPFHYAPRQCGSDDWDGSVTFSLSTQFGINIPDSFSVEGFLDTKTGPLVIPKQLASAEATVTTRICPD